MINFNWIYDSDRPIKVRTFLLEQGVTQTLLKNIRYHGGKLLVNRKPVFSSYQLSYGDQVVIVLPHEERNTTLQVSHLPIKILFENDNFLVVDKPVGVPTVTSRIYKDDTLTNRVLGYYLRHNYPSKTVHVVNRLDKDTSGPVIFAKNAFAHAVLDKQLKKHQIKKYYHAIVSGRIIPKHGEIILPIGRKPESFIERCVQEDGKYSRTEFWKEAGNDDATEVKIRLHTGRTHQIRVHFAAIGHPLLGDWLYNPNDLRNSTQLLHCYQVEFWDPFAEQTIRIYSGEPTGFERYV